MTPSKYSANTRSWLLVSLATLGGMLSPLFAKPVSNPSAVIDGLVTEGYSAHGVEPYAKTSDEVFLRRIYLDVIGRIPTREETRTFLQDTDAKKRDRLIDALLASEGYVHHFTNYWADLLRAKTQLTGAGQSRASGHAYMLWIKDALRQNLPYDTMVQKLLTAEGSSWDNGAVGFYIRDYGMPLDQMAVTTQVFLGTQVVCAQCHDHPFDSWKQLDYYKLAAFSYGSFTTNRAPVQNGAQKIWEKKKRNPEMTQDLRRAFSEILKPVRFNNVYHAEHRVPRLPHDYQYDNAKPKATVQPEIPAVIGGAELAVGEDERPVEAYARWMTSPENPRFTKVIANRLWKQAMGLGVIEPVDEFTDHTEATNPELMAYLEKLMVDLDYDMRAFLSIIFKTEVYQRGAHGEDVLAGLPYHFPGPILRRMTAEQIWDSMLTLVVDQPDAPSRRLAYDAEKRLAEAEWIANTIYEQTPSDFLKNGLEIANVQRDLADQLAAASLRLQEARENDDVKEIREANAQAAELRRALVVAIEERVYNEELEQKVEMVSAKGFGGCGDDAFLKELKTVVDDGAIDMSDSPNALRSGLKALLRDNFAAALGAEKKQEEAERKRWGVDSEAEKSYQRFDEKRDRLARAAELPSPAPPGHFLREFGQSDRDVVSNSNHAASVTQSLALLNGEILDAVFHPYSRMSRSLIKAKSPNGVIDGIYLNMLSRTATAEEKAILRPLFEGEQSRNEAIRQTVWSLLNTRQFLFVQ